MVVTARPVLRLSVVRCIFAAAAGLLFASLLAGDWWQDALADASPAPLVFATVMFTMVVASALVRTRLSLGVHRWAPSVAAVGAAFTIGAWVLESTSTHDSPADTFALAGIVLLYNAVVMIGAVRTYSGADRMAGVVLAGAVALGGELILQYGPEVARLGIDELTGIGIALLTLGAAFALVAMQGWRASAGARLAVFGALALLGSVLAEAGSPPGLATVIPGVVGLASIFTAAVVGDDGKPVPDHDWVGTFLVVTAGLFAATVLIVNASTDRGNVVADLLALVVLIGLLGRGTASNVRGMRRDPSELGGIDRLTGLPDRYELEAAMVREFEYAEQRNNPVALAILNLTTLHEINETLGHRVGDEVLREFAARLSGTVGTDLPVRLAGNSFALVMRSHATERDARDALERLIVRMEAPLQIDGVALSAHVRVGLAFFPAHGRTIAELLQRAEIASQEAKEKGLSLLIYDPVRDVRSRERLIFAGQLREGIERDELRVHFQPKIELSTGTCIGAEALVRWQHPTEGLLTPDRFLPIAEKTGQMGQLTNWVLDAALRQVRRWRLGGYDLHVAVNLSLANLVDPGLPSRLAQTLERYGLQGSSLTLEITEDIAMADPAGAAAMIAAIGQVGVRFSLDDFGTGYSSLAHLKYLACDELKIDRSFIRDIAGSEDDRVIVATILDLARSLGMRSVAEGIESEDVAELLARMGCQTGQGYNYARPLDADAFIEWCAEAAADGRVQLRGGGSHVAGPRVPVVD